MQTKASINQAEYCSSPETVLLVDCHIIKPVDCTPPDLKNAMILGLEHQTPSKQINKNQSVLHSNLLDDP